MDNQSESFAVVAERVFDGEKALTNRAVLVDKGVVVRVVPENDVPARMRQYPADP